MFQTIIIKHSEVYLVAMRLLSVSVQRSLTTERQTNVTYFVTFRYFIDKFILTIQPGGALLFANRIKAPELTYVFIFLNLRSMPRNKGRTSLACHIDRKLHNGHF